jgi:AcrR family transcriptional regulator
VATRTYSSPRREQQAADTRRAVVDAAARLFAAKGWAGTGMRDVAREAGVSVETVYGNFGSKSSVLIAALDAAVVGDLEAVALRDRPEFQALGKGTPPTRARRAAALNREINERTFGVRAALREAAAADAELATRLDDAEARRRTNVDEAARLVAGRAVTATERDGLWAVLGVEVYGLLVGHAGWSAEQYEKWAADMIVRILGLRGKERR